MGQSRLADRAGIELRKLLWRTFAGKSSEVTPVFVGGAQRSGTTMLGSCLSRNPEFRVYQENDADAFTDYFLRDQEHIRKLVAASPQRFVVFKPLTDSHRLADIAQSHGGLSVWMYRRAADRARSAVRKFGAHNLEILTQFAAGKQLDIWQARGLTEQDLELVRQFDFRTMSAEDAAALFWYLRNNLLFNQGLDTDPRNWLICYEDFVSNPAEGMQKLCRFLNARFSPFMIRRVHSRSVIDRDDTIANQRIAQMCAGMYARLEQLRAQKERLVAARLSA